MNMNESADTHAFPEEREIHDLLQELFNPTFQKMGDDITGKIGILQKPLKEIQSDVAGIGDLVNDEKFDAGLTQLQQKISSVSTTLLKEQSALNRTLLHGMEGSTRELTDSMAALKTDLKVEFLQLTETDRNLHREHKAVVVDQLDKVISTLAGKVVDAQEATLATVREEIGAMRSEVGRSLAQITGETKNAVELQEVANRVFKYLIGTVIILQAGILAVLLLR